MNMFFFYSTQTVSEVLKGEKKKSKKRKYMHDKNLQFLLHF